MRAVDIIIRKRDGGTLTDDEIRWFVDGVVSGAIPDYQASAWLMAAFLRGMAPGELGALTRAMIASGDRFDLSSIDGPTVDKHSTGGVGDKVSLVLAPLVAAAGGRVPMVSGRSLGHTGGTLDKLESIPGYQTRLDEDRFRRQVGSIGCAIIGQSDNFVPADKKLYALRDVTGTVESVPLIAASILSKKIASGAGAFVMDVKTGSGAFMDTEARARELAETLHRLGAELERPVVSLLTDMNQPLGRWVGNRHEVIESVETLEGKGEFRLTEICLDLGAWMLRLSGIEADLETGRRRLANLLTDGSAADRFARMIEAQGGDARIVENPARLEVADRRLDIVADRDGWVAECDTRAVGVASMLLGGGREAVGDAIDPRVGIEWRVTLGERVSAGQPLFTAYYTDESKRDRARDRLEGAVRIAGEAPEALPLIRTVIGADAAG